MAFRDDMISLVDELRREIVDEEFELRLDTVQTVIRHWTGNDVGRGTPDVISAISLDPVPKISRPSPERVASSAGVFEAGDVVASRVSASYTEDQVSRPVLERGQEFLWSLNGALYTVVSADREYLEWRVHLRKRRP